MSGWLKEREREREREIPSRIKVIQNVILHGQLEFREVMAHPSKWERERERVRE